ncbi:MAG TPA: nucleoside 2-deoxyribosyltransferase [Vicinamibacterales bacterium]|nr:nucleoside 2-deoxyribosyltransferase [Vicinamibacterales bacterium]
MRIYLACTVRGDRGAIDAARHIHACLVGLGHEVLTGHLLRDDVAAAEDEVGDAAVFARDMAWLESADAVVAEASGSSYGVGFEVGYALGRSEQTGQRVLVLYDASRRGRVSRLIAGMNDPRARVLAYESPSDIDAFLASSLSTATISPSVE